MDDYDEGESAPANVWCNAFVLFFQHGGGVASVHRWPCTPAGPQDKDKLNLIAISQSAKMLASILASSHSKILIWLTIGIATRN